MKVSISSIATKYDVEMNVICLAVHSNGVKTETREKNGLPQSYVEEEEALEAIGSYIAQKLHDSYVVYNTWEKRAKRFDAKILGKEYVEK